MAKQIEVKIESHLPEILAATDAAIERALEAVGLQAEGHAKDVITAEGRVDTGRLRGSIAHQVEAGEKAVYIGSNLEYAVYNEIGTGIYTEGGGGRKTPWVYVDDKGVAHRTVGMKPIHFLKRAATEHDSEYAAIFEKYLKDG